MRSFKIPGSRLELPRRLNGVELSSEPGNVSFRLGSATVKRVPQESDGRKVQTLSLGLHEPGAKTTLACLFLEMASAKVIAENLRKAIEEA